MKGMPPKVEFDAEDEGLHWNEFEQVSYYSITGGADSTMFKAM